MVTAFLRDLGHRVKQCTGVVRVMVYLLLHLTVALQRGNAVCVESVGMGESGLDLFCMLCMFNVCMYVYLMCC